MIGRFFQGIERFVRRRFMGGYLYKRGLIIALCITSIPLAVLSLGVYYFGTKYMETEMKRTYQLQLTQAVNRIDDLFNQLELSVNRLSFTPELGERLRTLNEVTDFPLVNDLYKMLVIQRTSNPLISNIYLYLRSGGLLISDEAGTVPVRESGLSEQLNAYMEDSRFIFWSADASAADSSGSFTLISKLPGGNLNPYGALIIQLDRSKIDTMIRELSQDNNGAAILMRKDGVKLSSGGGAGASNEGLENVLLDKLRQDRESFILPWQGESYSVSQHNLVRLGDEWIFATAAPLSKMTAPVVWMSRLIFVISCIGLLIAVLLSWFASSHIYRPIKRIIQLFHGDRSASVQEANELDYIESRWKHVVTETSRMQRRLEQYYPAVREGFLLKLIAGHYYSLTEEELRGRMVELGWETAEETYAVLLVQLSGLSNPSGKFHPEDKELVTFAAENILKESALMHQLNAHTINFRDLSVGLVIQVPGGVPDDQMKRSQYDYARSVIDTLQSILKMNVIVTLGGASDKVKRIPRLLDDARQLSRYRGPGESNTIIDADDLLPAGKYADEYPLDIEKRVMQSFRLGSREEMERTTHAFVQELARHCSTEWNFHLGLIQLLGVLQHTMVQTGADFRMAAQAENLFEQLMQIREPDEAADWFVRKIIEPYLHQLEAVRQTENKRLIQEVAEYIDGHYMEELSLEHCAEQFAANPFQLSRAFKQEAGLNFVDYVTKVRVDKSKELLLQSDLKINDIAEKVGYNPSYFIKVFKKSEGMTPRHYRVRNDG